MNAYACKITQENFSIIASEKPDFNLEETLAWLDENGDGYFVRDEDSPWDCAYLAQVVFNTIYLFETFDPDDVFHPIIMT